MCIIIRCFESAQSQSFKGSYLLLYDLYVKIQGSQETNLTTYRLYHKSTTCKYTMYILTYLLFLLLSIPITNKKIPTQMHWLRCTTILSSATTTTKTFQSALCILSPTTQIGQCQNQINNFMRRLNIMLLFFLHK